MKIGSSTPLMKPAKTMILAGVFVSPPARMMALPTMGTTRKTMPNVHSSMYSTTSSSTRPFAPSATKSGSSAKYRAAVTGATTTTPRLMAPVASVRTCA